jgi:hypothetical protein
LEPGRPIPQRGFVGLVARVAERAERIHRQLANLCVLIGSREANDDLGWQESFRYVSLMSA